VIVEKLDYTPVLSWQLPPVVRLLQKDAAASFLSLLEDSDEEGKPAEQAWTLLQEAGFEEPAAGWEAVLTDGAPEAAAEEKEEVSDSDEVAVVGAEPPPSDEPELRLRAAPPDVAGPASTTGKEALCAWRGQPECGAMNDANGALDACKRCRFYFHHKCAIRNDCEESNLCGRCDPGPAS
jgi:hypothetical protein